MTWIFPLSILIFFELIADIFAKEWSLGRHSIIYAAIALLAYLLANTYWLIALKNGSGLVRGAVLFSVASAILATGLVFLFYKEQLSTIQVTGVMFGIISIILIFWQ